MEKHRRGGGGDRTEGGGGRGHCTVRVNQGTLEPLPSDLHPSDRGCVN